MSPTAKLVFYTCLECAGDLEQDGALYVRGVGAMTIMEIAGEVGIKSGPVGAALDDLIKVGLMTKRADGAYVIEKFAEKTAPADPTAAERKRRSRGKSRVTPAVTSQGQSRVHTRSQEGEGEAEVDSGTSVPAWAAEIESAVRGIKAVQLRDLSADERFVLARYHAYRLAGCTRSEPTNKRKAIALATGIANLTDRLSRNPAKADLTVDEYIALGARLRDRAGSLVHNAMDILPEIELEAEG